MIAVGSKLRSIDNSGARIVECVKILGGKNKKNGKVGDFSYYARKSKITLRHLTLRCMMDVGHLTVRHLTVRHLTVGVKGYGGKV